MRLSNHWEKGIKAIYLNSMLRNMAGAIAGIFLPIYIYQWGGLKAVAVLVAQVVDYDSSWKQKRNGGEGGVIVVGRKDFVDIGTLDDSGDVERKLANTYPFSPSTARSPL